MTKPPHFEIYFIVLKIFSSLLSFCRRTLFQILPWKLRYYPFTPKGQKCRRSQLGKFPNLISFLFLLPNPTKNHKDSPRTSRIDTFHQIFSRFVQDLTLNPSFSSFAHILLVLACFCKISFLGIFFIPMWKNTILAAYISNKDHKRLSIKG